MQGLSTRTYMLAVKKGKKDYVLLDNNTLPGFESANLNTLGGIDTFTSNHFKTDLLDSIVNEGIIKDKKKFEGFVTVFKENGKFKELREGTIFKEDEMDISYDSFVDFLVSNGSDKSLRNYILNLNFGDMKSRALEKFLEAFEDYENLAEIGEKTLRSELSLIKDVPYQEYRIIAISAYKKIKGINE